MPGNSFGQLFRITTFGESHGPAMGVVIDGCPSGLKITREDIQKELDRRRPGQNDLSSPRKETDQVEILSGIFEDKSTGTPIALLIRNQDANPKDYEELKDLYRPGHADFTYEAKYGHRDWRGGGRASARETVSRVAAGAIAKLLLKEKGIQITGEILGFDQAKVDSARADGDSLGGIIQITASGGPAGLGEPVFHKLSADLAAGIMSIPAVKGIEIGDGFAAARHRGSENNDEWIQKDGKIQPKTNHAGGILGGISTGADIVLRFALKPASSIAKPQNTVDKAGNPKTIEITGRHDPYLPPRAIPIGEAMVALVLADHLLLN